MILFLDDMEWRHREFDRLTERDPQTVVRVYSAAMAISSLDEFEFAQVFLDHDLSEEDVMVEPGAESKMPTGMAVVDHILQMESPPQDIIVHSCNGPAREEMVRRLEESGRIKRVRGIPFPELIQRILVRP